MISLLSPTKTLDWKTPAPVDARRRPRFLEHAAPVSEQLRQYRVADLAALFGVSEKTAALAYDRIQSWSTAGHGDNCRPAVFAFSGPVYRSMDPRSFTADELAYADERFLILSGLYGVLSPLDGILPYRLDMGAPLSPPGAKKLVDYWRDAVTRTVGSAAERTGSEAVLNLASKEYVSAVDADRLPVPLIECRFEERRGDGYRQVRNRVKQTRGLIASFLARTGVHSVEEAKRFRLDGFRYSPERSDARTLAFLREGE